MRLNNGLVDGITTKTVKTRFGEKPVYKLVIDGNEYEVGFKKPSVSPGDYVSFDYEFKYGANKVDERSLSTGYDKSAGASTPASALKNAGGGGRGNFQPKVFPVPLDHGDRSIIRQNSLTNARELYVATIPHGEIVSLDGAVDAILDIAAKFEKYSAGDYEREAAEAMMED